MKINKGFWNITSIISVWILMIINVIGVIADLFGFAEGIEEHGDTIRGILSFIAIRWKFSVVITVVLFTIIFYNRRAWKREMRARDTRRLSWFDAQKRATKYIGGGEYLNELSQFFRSNDEGFLWWVITGKAGMGKTRLVREVLNQDEFGNADVKWIESFEDYREDALKERVDSILESQNCRNILIADDAQIYMDNISALIEYLSGKKATEIGAHRIRLLLLIRMGEDEDLRYRYKQLASRTSHHILKETRFADYSEELRIEKYCESDIADIIRSYLEITKKERDNENLTEEQISAMKKTVLDALKAMGDQRPLFAMFIADAVLAGKNPMYWDKEQVLEYAVIEREEQLLEYETRDIKEMYYSNLFEIVKGITCLSVIRSGFELSELDAIKDEMEDELKFSRIGMKGFLKELQFLGNDGIVRVHMPDILAEYYVLRTLVIGIIDNKDNIKWENEEAVEWILGRLIESLEGAWEFRQKVRQDYRYMYEGIEVKLDDFYQEFFKRCSCDLAFDILSKIIDSHDIYDSNAIVLHEAISSISTNEKVAEKIAAKLCDETYKDDYSNEDKWEILMELRRVLEKQFANDSILLMYSIALVNMSDYAVTIEDRYDCLKELKQLERQHPENRQVALMYSKGLVNLAKNTFELVYDTECIPELKRLWEVNNNVQFAESFSGGLYNVLKGTFAQEEKLSCLSELSQLFRTYPNNAKILRAYSRGLTTIINDVPSIDEKRECLLKLSILSQTYYGDAEVIQNYGAGLNLFFMDTTDMEEKQSCLLKLSLLSEAFPMIADVEYIYSQALITDIGYASNIQEKRECLFELSRLSGKHPNDGTFMLSYLRGLYNMIIVTDGADSYVLEFRRLLSNTNFAKYVAKMHPDIFNYYLYSAASH